MATDDNAAAPQNLSARAHASHATPAASCAESIGDAIPRLPREGATQSFPLSPAQQRLWFLQQFEQGSGFYNIAKGFRLRGVLDHDALTRGVNEIVRRHESLRSAFAETGGQAAQIVASAVELPLPVVDLGSLSPAEREAEIERMLVAEEKRAFDLAQPPLMRISLARLGEQDHVLFLTLHHIISDAWSFSVLYRELTELYRAYRAGQPSPLPELTLQYADFAVWQTQRLDGGALDQQLAYWKRQLGGALPALELPLDGRRPAVQNFDGGRQQLALPATLSDALRHLSRRADATLFTTLLAAFQLLLCRYSGQEDIVLGLPKAGRNQFGTEALIGFFIGTLVIRADLSGNPSFAELLRRVRKAALDAYAHQDVPFEKLVEALQPERNPGRNPIFDVLINHISSRWFQPLALDDIVIERLQSAEVQSKFALTLYIREEDRRFNLELIYQRSLFSAERAACILDQYRYLLEQICQAPERPIQSYSLITPATRVLLPDPAFPITETDYGLVNDKIAARVRRAPANRAVCQGSRSWSYSELWTAANALAQALRERGLRAKDAVAISAPKSFGLIACMTGVLLSGGVMLTVDRNFPARRQNLLLRETGAKYLLYVGDFRTADDWMRRLAAITIIAVDADSAEPTQSMGTAEYSSAGAPAISGDDPAYIFFTSGTTGIPKGILGCHKGLSHFLAWQRAAFAIGPQDRCAQLTALSFDVLLRDVFLPLTSGASVHLPDEREGLPTGDVLSWLAREKISVLHTVPARAQSWLSDLPGKLSLPALRWTFFSGEPLNDTLVRRWRGLVGASGIVNLYGPTETTMAKCFYRVPGNGLSGAQPVGHPLPQTQALVLSAAGDLCGIGEPGEIALRTPFRTLGYLNATNENRRRFIKNRFRDDDNDLLYLTGDRGRYRPDGLLAIEGRLDDQVKINGVRVEPGEAGALLSQHPALQSCAVIARKGDRDDQFLAAYVVTRKDQRVAASELRAFLAARAPAFLMPSVFTFLDALPLMSNGKIDRQALPASDTRVQTAKPYIAPATANEQVLADIWRDVLKREQVGVDDNFFELGGHSLLATKVIARLRQAFQCEIPLRVLFESPTVASLAAEIGRLQTAKNEAPVSVVISEHLMIENIARLSDSEIDALLDDVEKS